MLNLLKLFMFATTTVPEAPVDPVVEPEYYSLTETIIWYSLLVLMILIVILYYKFIKQGKLTVTKIEKAISNEVEKIENATEQKKQTLNISGVFHILNISKMEFIELRDKTSLPDMDEILRLSDETMALVRKREVVKLSNEESLKKLGVITKNLKEINEKLKVVEALVH